MHLSAHHRYASTKYERVHLPDHLEQRSLVMQQQNGTLSIATKHVWALC